jgi:eukaryotic-like serine/threonine-protein kinase
VGVLFPSLIPGGTFGGPSAIHLESRVTVPDRLTAALADRYRLEHELGAGGMATVYLAADLKHDRKVAIKVLKPDLAAVLGAERFVTEIKTTAALQHPHILPLFDSGTADGFLFYVMPFVEGETLRTRLDRERQLGIEEAVRIAREVADALDYAHRHGVIHRDIKPENILLHDGRATVADFGIALAVSAAAGGRMTETGLSLGTPHYMSPEQATAEREITGRSDIYSLGCVLYEMLTGNPPHVGATAQQIIMKIVTEEAAPVTTLRKAVPPHVADAVAQALEKLPADRFDSAKAFSEALTGTGTVAARRAPTADRTGAGRSSGTPLSPPRLIAGAVALAVLAALAGWGLGRSGSDEALPPVTRFGFAPEDDGRLRDPAGSPIALSPDGSRIVYTGRDSLGQPMLYLRELGNEIARPLPGTEGAGAPAFSPDGQQVAFGQGGRTRRMSLAGGGILTVVDRSSTGFSWGPDDHLYFGSTGTLGLWRVPITGGGIDTVIVGDPTSGVSYRWPDALPDGRGVLITLVRNGQPELAAVSLPDGSLHEFGQPGMYPRWLDGGYVAYLQVDGTLMVAPFDARRWRLAGRAVPVAQEVSYGPAFPGKLGLSRTGVLAFLPGGLSINRDLLLLAADGRSQEIPVPNRGVTTPRFSPDGRRVVMEIQDYAIAGLGDVWLYDLQARSLTRLSTDSASRSPEWLPGGRHVAYLSRNRLLRVPIDGSALADTLAELRSGADELQVDRAGSFVVYRAVIAGQRRVYQLSLGADRAERQLTRGAFDEAGLALSPDGEWLAYLSDESGSRELYVRRLAGEQGRWRVPARGATEPRWSADGRTLMYRDGDTLLAAGFTPGPEPAFAEPRRLLEAAGIDIVTTVEWDRSPDGSRYVVVARRDAGSGMRMVIMLHWLDHIRRQGR